MRVIWLLAVLALAGCGGGDSAAPAEPTPVALVTLAAATAGSLERTVTLYGAAESSAAGGQSLNAPVEAVVSAIPVAVGQPVSRGQVIARLSPASTTKLDLVRASADARAADAAYQRAKRLRADGLVGDAEVESARAAATSTDATRKSLSAQANGLTLRAPVAGIVETVPVRPGDRVMAAVTIATLVRPGNLRARFGVEPAIARTLTPGDRVLVTPGSGLAPVAAPILSVSPIVDPQTGLASLFAAIPDQSGIAAGTSLTGEVTVGRSGDTLTIPYEALLDEGGQPYVFTVSGGVAHRQDVTVGPVSGGRVAITKGLAAGAQVVVKGGTALDDGVKVRTK